MNPGALDPARFIGSSKVATFRRCTPNISEEFVIESLGLALFVMGVLPFLSEPRSSMSYLVP